MLSLKVKRKGFLKINGEKSLVQVIETKDKKLNLKIYKKNDGGTYNSAITYTCPLGISTKIDEDLEVTYLGGGNNSIRVGFVGSAKIHRANGKVTFTVGPAKKAANFDFNFDTEGY